MGGPAAALGTIDRPAWGGAASRLAPALAARVARWWVNLMARLSRRKPRLKPRWSLANWVALLPAFEAGQAAGGRPFCSINRRHGLAALRPLASSCFRVATHHLGVELLRYGRADQSGPAHYWQRQPRWRPQDPPAGWIETSPAGNLAYPAESSSQLAQHAALSMRPCA